MFDFLRVSSVVPKLRVGDVGFNTDEIIKNIKSLRGEGGGRVVLFPELCLTGYTCGDLFLQNALLSRAEEAVETVAEYTEGDGNVYIIGSPIRFDGLLFNCAVVICGGKVCGIVPKTYIPNNSEFYEKRWFSSGTYFSRYGENGAFVSRFASSPRIGSNLLFRLNDGTEFGVEICEDLWAPIPPSAKLALNGAEVIFNLSASNETISKREYRRGIVVHQSASCVCAYCYCSAGQDESTTDLVFSGHTVIACGGVVVAENDKVIDGDYILTSDIDIGRIRADRIKSKTYADCAMLSHGETVTVPVDMTPRSDGKYISVAKLPFVPSSAEQRAKRCRDIFELQVAGLKKRLEVTGATPVIGISGGLDSTLALLVAVKALKKMGKSASDAVGITMPGFGTTGLTYKNSLDLMLGLGVTSREISIVNASLQHMKDIGHDESVHDITYENTQARERTQILMDYANKIGGLVVGTGDLSELALGWCTYNADHMSMYGVNCGVPKTLVRWLIESVADDAEFEACRDTLVSILNTPISPELLPPDAEGKIAQKTEDKVGPYALHDFFMYYMLRFGYSPEKIYFLAKKAFAEDFESEEILKWLRVFYRRFFSQQFKRSCLPDGVKVGSVCLSPRGDWRMPSDASASLWLSEIDKLK